MWSVHLDMTSRRLSAKATPAVEGKIRCAASAATTRPVRPPPPREAATTSRAPSTAMMRCGGPRAPLMPATFHSLRPRVEDQVGKTAVAAGAAVPSSSSSSSRYLCPNSGDSFVGIAATTATATAAEDRALEDIDCRRRIAAHRAGGAFRRSNVFDLLESSADDDDDDGDDAIDDASHSTGAALPAAGAKKTVSRIVGAKLRKHRLPR